MSRGPPQWRNEAKRRLLLAIIALVAGTSAQAKYDQPAQAKPNTVVAQVIAVPAMPTPIDVPTAAGDTAELGRQVAEVIASSLRFTGLFDARGPDAAGSYTYAQAVRPVFGTWREAGAKRLVAGFVEVRADGQLTVACYLYDVTARRELTRKGFVVAPADWRRAAARCADTVYAQATGKGGFLDSRIAYVAETGPRNLRQKRVAVMELDGSGHRFLTGEGSTVLMPRFSPDGSRLIYLSYVGGRPSTYVRDLATGSERPLMFGPAMTSAASFSPDSSRIAFALSDGGNTDIYVVAAGGGTPIRLTSAPGIDTSPSFSPDGRRIAFASDRGGSQQLYVMDADGSNQRRISFGGGSYGSPAWSPSGDLIAFAREGAFHIGTMRVDGTGERILTDGWQDEAPSWAPNGQHLLFSRATRDGKFGLFTVPANGGPAQPLPTPQDGSDPSWSPLQR